MTGKKELQIAKSLFRKSLTDGSVNSKKVRTILKELSSQRVSRLVGILRAYRRLLSSALSQEEVVVESATKITNLNEFEKEIKVKTKAKRIVYKINPKIIIGAKITHGDWIYDSTLSAKLERLTMSN